MSNLGLFVTLMAIMYVCHVCRNLGRLSGSAWLIFHMAPTSIAHSALPSIRIDTAT
jgi:hypothetical protein